MIKTLVRVAATTTAVTAISLAGLAAPAAATPQWFGEVHETVNTSTRYGGWVDGNGPDSYIAWADCNNGSLTTGVERWAGDRRGSFAACASGIQPGRNHRGFFLINND
jgi:hypothetical protein